MNRTIMAKMMMYLLLATNINIAIATCSWNDLNLCTDETSCNAVDMSGSGVNVTAGWVTDSDTMSCKKCGNCDPSGCSTKTKCDTFTCGNGVYVFSTAGCKDCAAQLQYCDQAACAKVPGGIWANQMCKKCPDGQALQGCGSKVVCEAVKDSENRSAVWKGSSCNWCNEWNQLASCSQEACAKLGQYKNTSTSWVKSGEHAGAEMECRACIQSKPQGCTTKKACEALNGTAWKNATTTKPASCGQCSETSYDECNKEKCEAMKKSWVKDGQHEGAESRCRECTQHDTMGCTTKEACEALNGTAWNPADLSMAKAASCGHCSATSYHGCNKEKCEALKLDGGKVASWLSSRNRCGVCTKDDTSSCGKDACLALKVEGQTMAWKEEENRCAKCGNCDTDGCITKSSCESFDPTKCDSMKDAKFAFKESDKRCTRCSKDSISDCSQTDCSTMGGAWIASDNRCGKCSEYDKKACTTEKDCKGSGEDAVWANNECRRCHKDDYDGCNTKASCEGLNEKDSTAISFKCDERCVKEESKTTKCEADGPDDCTKDQCSKLKKEGMTFTYIDASKRCRPCGGHGEVDGCITKATCEAVKFDWGKSVWNAATGACRRCGTHVLDGCANKADCESVTDKTGKKAIWKGTWCSMNCNLDEIGSCTTKAGCNGLGNSKIKWSESKGACTKCSKMPMNDEMQCRATEMCMSQKEDTLEFCMQATAECDVHCKGREAECTERYGYPPVAAANGTAMATATTFDIKVTVAKASEFDEAKYLAEMSKSTGVDAAAVTIVKKEFTVEVSYSFSADKAITKEDAATAVAADWKVDKSLVEVTINTRRLGEGRRLAVETKITATLKTTDPAQADLVKTASATTTGVADQLKTVASVTVAVTVSKAATIEVKITTKVTSAKAITKPDAAQLDSIAKASGGTGATLDLTSWTEKAVPATTGTKTTTSGAAATVIMVPVAAIIAFLLV